jgi:hypothetical protein
MPKDIAAFLDSYKDAFNALDGSRIADLYSVPSGIAHDGGYTHWPTRETIVSNMAALCVQYRENGYEKASYQPVSYLPLGEKYAVVQVAWRIGRTEGRDPWEFSTTYNLMRTGEAWHVLLCTAHDEARLPAASEA